MHSPNLTGEQFARRLHVLNASEAIAFPPHEPVGNFVLRILDKQPDSPLVSATVQFTGQDPESGVQVFGTFDVSGKPLAETLRYRLIEDLAILD